MAAIIGVAVAGTLLVANLLFKCGAHILARRVNEWLLSSVPSMGGLISLNLASLYAESGDIAGALRILERGRATAAETTPFDLEMAKTLERARRYDEARTIYERILADDIELGSDFRYSLSNHINRLKELAANE